MNPKHALREAATNHDNREIPIPIECDRDTATPPSVLVVDNEPMIRRVLVNWLKGWGFPVSEAGNASDAVKSMLVAPSDIVLCDIKMPGHDGLWLMDKIRQEWPRSVVVMTTAVTDTEAVVQSRRLGAIDYVVKPFGRELLLQALARATTKLQLR